MKNLETPVKTGRVGRYVYPLSDKICNLETFWST